MSVRDFEYHLNNVKEVNGHSVASSQMAHASQKLNKMKAASKGSVRNFWDYENGMCNIKAESEGSVSSSQITSSSLGKNVTIMHIITFLTIKINLVS